MTNRILCPLTEKNIEVNIPFQAINRESAKDTSFTHGYPSTLHHYWARRPVAACRAVIFASMIDGPSEGKDEFPTELLETELIREWKSKINLKMNPDKL